LKNRSDVTAVFSKNSEKGKEVVLRLLLAKL